MDDAEKTAQEIAAAGSLEFGSEVHGDTRYDDWAGGGYGFETLAIHAGQDPDPTTGAVIVPIYQTSTYVQSEVGRHSGYEYSRSGNPTRTALETCLAALEGGRTGLAFASGLAAEDCLLRTATSPGGHVVIPDDAYGGTYRLFARVLERWGVEHTPVALGDRVVPVLPVGEVRRAHGELAELLDRHERRLAEAQGRRTV